MLYGLWPSPPDNGDHEEGENGPGHDDRALTNGHANGTAQMNGDAHIAQTRRITDADGHKAGFWTALEGDGRMRSVSRRGEGEGQVNGDTSEDAGLDEGMRNLLLYFIARSGERGRSNGVGA